MAGLLYGGEMIAVWLFLDALLWISGQNRYMIFFERVFATPESAASQMRWVQGLVAVVFGSVCVVGLLSVQRRASRREISDEKNVGLAIRRSERQP